MDNKQTLIGIAPCANQPRTLSFERRMRLFNMTLRVNVRMGGEMKDVWEWLYDARRELEKKYG